MATQQTQIIADQVNTARKLQEIPLSRLADATGIPRTSLKRKIYGQYDFTVPELMAVSQYLGLRLSDVLREFLDAA